MVSGSDVILANRVVAEVLSGVVRYSTTEVVRLHGNSKASELDAALKQYSQYSRVVVLEDVQKIKDVSFITEWLDGLQKGDRSVVLVATADKVRSARGEDRWIPKHPEVCYIDCTELSQDSLFDYIRGEFPKITTSLAHLILNRCGEVPSVVMNECNKLKMFPELDEALVRSVVMINSESDAVEALLDGRIGDLLAVSKSVDLRQFIGGVTYRLIQIVLIVLLRGKRLTARELMDRTGIPPYQIGQRLDQAKVVTLETVLKRFVVLYKVDKLIRSGSETGTIEYLLSMW
jgi:DNA polymerase III delta subunit